MPAAPDSRRHDPRASRPEVGDYVLLWIALAFAVACAAVAPLDEVLSGAAIEFATTAQMPPVVEQAIKALGKADVLALVLLLVCLTHRRRAAVEGLVALLLVAIPITVLKYLFHRTRPDHGGFSFPSGDCTSVAAAFLPLAFAARSLRWPIVAAIVGVGLCRVLAAYHYPSDVLGGVALGASVAWLAVRVTPRRLGRARPRIVLPMLALALAACGVTAATSNGEPPFAAFAWIILPIVATLVLRERLRLTRFAVGRLRRTSPSRTLAA